MSVGRRRSPAGVAGGSGAHRVLVRAGRTSGARFATLRDRGVRRTVIDNDDRVGVTDRGECSGEVVGPIAHGNDDGDVATAEDDCSGPRMHHAGVEQPAHQALRAFGPAARARRPPVDRSSRVRLRSRRSSRNGDPPTSTDPPSIRRTPGRARPASPPATPSSSGPTDASRGRGTSRLVRTERANEASERARANHQLAVMPASTGRTAPVTAALSGAAHPRQHRRDLGGFDEPAELVMTSEVLRVDSIHRS